jgi:hypothetical protein
MAVIPVQRIFDNPLVKVEGCAEYDLEWETLHTINDLLLRSGIENLVIADWLLKAEEQKKARLAEQGRPPKELTYLESLEVQRNAVTALRAGVLRKWLGFSLREFCRMVAHARLYQWFCRVGDIRGVQLFSKSTLHYFESNLSAELMREVNERLLSAAASDTQKKLNDLGLEAAVSLDTVYADTFCCKANIHFPVDWLLLRDGVRTLMLAIEVIRSYGLRHRLPDSPASFISQINKECIKMTQAYRQTDSRRERKAALRRLKKITKICEEHAKRYRDLLEREWEKTTLGRGQKDQIVQRMTRILELLPEARRQAHERIIGGRQVKNEDKILSLYESEIHVIVRGKPGAAVEFGNKVLIAEQDDGLIVDWKLYRDKAPGDARTLQESLERMDRILDGRDRVKAACTDRGFDSSDNREYLRERSIYNALCPRDPRVLGKRMKEPKFAAMQKRRSQTEARIGILVNNFLGEVMLQKGYARRESHFGLAVLSHNFWRLAKIRLQQEAERESSAERRRRA